jgi:chromosome segregation ATPase
MANNDDMREQLQRVESKVDGLETTTNATRHEMTAVAGEMDRLSDRMHGVEERLDALNTRIDVTKDELRGDIKLALERIDGLRQFMERKAQEGQKERAGDQRLLYALVKDHNRRLRALERLERRQHRQPATH